MWWVNTYLRFTRLKVRTHLIIKYNIDNTVITDDTEELDDIQFVNDENKTINWDFKLTYKWVILFIFVLNLYPKVTRNVYNILWIVK